MYVLLGLSRYCPNGSHAMKPALAYSARAGANDAIAPVSKLKRE